MNLDQLQRKACGASVISPYESKIEIGGQGQRLSRAIAHDTAGCERISGGLVIMPPKKVARPHIHKDNEIILFVIEGWGAALVGPELEPIFHGPGDFIYIPAGCEHLGVNISSTDRIVIAEIRTDPNFNDDLIVLPELEDKAHKIAEDLWQKFEKGEVLPEAKTESPVFSYDQSREMYKEPTA